MQHFEKKKEKKKIYLSKKHTKQQIKNLVIYIILITIFVQQINTERKTNRFGMHLRSVSNVWFFCFCFVCTFYFEINLNVCTYILFNLAIKLDLIANIDDNTGKKKKTETFYFIDTEAN